MLQTLHSCFEGGHGCRVPQVRRHRDRRSLGLLRDRLDEPWRELLIHFQAVHPARKKLPRHITGLLLRRHRDTDLRTVARQGAIDQRAAREGAGSR